MSRTKHTQDRKEETLRRQGTLHPHPERVADGLFRQSDFFDPRDLLQVKYEMLRQVHQEGKEIAGVAKTFGFSRPSVYKAQAALRRDGLAGLVGLKHGPRRAHKLDATVITFLQEQRTQEPSLTLPQLAQRIQLRFQRQVHPRSISRALQRHEKKTI